MEEQFRVRWASHQGTVLSVIDALLSSDYLVDVTLACEGESIRAHKLILSACSPYFQKLLNVDQSKHPIFFLKDVKFTELKALIMFMYRGEVTVAQDDLPSLLAVAQSLQIRGLADANPANNGIISSDTIILPEVDLGNKAKVAKPLPPPLFRVPKPLPTVDPKPKPSASLRPASQATVQERSHQTNGVPPSKKSRNETPSGQHTIPATQSQSEAVDPLQMVSTVGATHYDLPTPSYSGHAQPRDFSQLGIVEDTEPFGTGEEEPITFVPAAPIVIDLEEEEQEEICNNQSNVSECYDVYDSDTQMPDDDHEEIPGEFGGNHDDPEADGEENGGGGVFCSTEFPSACGSITFGSSTRGFPTAYYKNRRFHMRSESNRRSKYTTWRCSNRHTAGCTGLLKTDVEGRLVALTPHNDRCLLRNPPKQYS